MTRKLLRSFVLSVFNKVHQVLGLEVVSVDAKPHVRAVAVNPLKSSLSLNLSTYCNGFID
jgi:hypothetical protein